MALTELDPTTALIVIDLQSGLATRDDLAPYTFADVVARTRALVDVFDARELPVVYVTVAGTPPGRTDSGVGGHRLPAEATQLVAEFTPKFKDLTVTKYARSAFSGTGLADELRRRSITQVVVTGVATSSGVESTARDAHEAGFHVTLPVDAMTDSRADQHDRSIAEIFPRIAQTGSLSEVLALVAAQP